MSNENTQWVEELFLILDIPATKEEWQKKLELTLNSLKNEVQFMISTLNNEEHQLIQEAQKRVTSFYINGNRCNLTTELRIAASELLLRNKQPELALTILQPLDMEKGEKYLINFGRALMQIGILDQARHCFIAAAECAPESPEPLFHLGFQTSLAGDVEAAIRFYSEALDLDEKHLGSLLNLAYIYYQMEQFDKAIEIGEKVIALDNSNLGGYLSIISCLNALKQFEESARYLAKARSKVKVEALELDELEAVTSFEMEDYQRTVDLVTRYINARPKAVDFCYIRAKANIKLENWDNALVDIDRLLDLEPFDTESLDMRFNVFFSAQRWEEAEVAYVKLLDNAPHLRSRYKQQYTELRKNLAIVIG